MRTHLLTVMAPSLHLLLIQNVNESKLCMQLHKACLPRCLGPRARFNFQIQCPHLLPNLLPVNLLSGANLSHNSPPFPPLPPPHLPGPPAPVNIERVFDPTPYLRWGLKIVRSQTRDPEMFVLLQRPPSQVKTAVCVMCLQLSLPGISWI